MIIGNMSASSTDLPRTRAAIVTAAEVVGAMPDVALEIRVGK